MYVCMFERRPCRSQVAFRLNYIYYAGGYRASARGVVVVRVCVCVIVSTCLCLRRGAAASLSVRVPFCVECMCACMYNHVEVIVVVSSCLYIVNNVYLN